MIARTILTTFFVMVAAFLLIVIQRLLQDVFKIDACLWIVLLLMFTRITKLRNWLFEQQNIGIDLNDKKQVEDHARKKFTHVSHVLEQKVQNFMEKHHNEEIPNQK